MLMHCLFDAYILATILYSHTYYLIMEGGHKSTL